jgi:hypothetical protein
VSKKTYRLTADCKPPKRERVLLFRGDSKQWDIGWVDERFIGHPQYAYKHWRYLPKAPSAL